MPVNHTFESHSPPYRQAKWHLDFPQYKNKLVKEDSVAQFCDLTPSQGSCTYDTLYKIIIMIMLIMQKDKK